jgi:hypothetical protein
MKGKMYRMSHISGSLFTLHSYASLCILGRTAPQPSNLSAPAPHTPATALSSTLQIALIRTPVVPFHPGTLLDPLHSHAYPSHTLSFRPWRAS